MFNRAVEEVKIKKKTPALSKVRFDTLKEGLLVDIMHIDPFSDEGSTIKKLHNFIKEKHHAIYLSDIRRIESEKMKIVIRQPMR